MWEKSLIANFSQWANESYKVGDKRIASCQRFKCSQFENCFQCKEKKV